jgi:hypothetical protein
VNEAYILMLSVIIRGHGHTDVTPYQNLLDCQRIKNWIEVQMVEKGVSLLESRCEPSYPKPQFKPAPVTPETTPPAPQYATPRVKPNNKPAIITLKTFKPKAFKSKTIKQCQRVYHLVNHHRKWYNSCKRSKRHGR